MSTGNGQLKSYPYRGTFAGVHWNFERGVPKFEVRLKIDSAFCGSAWGRSPFEGILSKYCAIIP